MSSLQPASRASPTNPWQVPGFDIVRQIGYGGMARVFLANQISPPRQVALKVLSPHFSTSRKAVERFLREARAASAIRHPNVVQVFGIGNVGDQHWIAMEFVDGATIHNLLRSTRRLSQRLSVDIARQIAAALVAAHACNVLHRDLTPRNVLVCTAGQVKLADFGLAKVEDGDTAALTSPGALVGTPMFMSPEQALGMAVDARSDVYGVGMLLYLMVGGVYPYRARTSVELLEQIITRPLPSLLVVRPDLDPRILAVIDRSTRKERDERFQSASELHTALVQMLRDARQLPRTGSSATHPMIQQRPPKRPASERPVLEAANEYDLTAPRPVPPAPSDPS